MINKSYSTFFKELAQNNHKEWFHANKTRYENTVKGPFLNLLETILPRLVSWDQNIFEDAKKALFRINRDIRFSKDKSPYHTIMKAGFSPGGKKSELPGYYLGIDAEHVHVGGGLFMVRPPQLLKVRQLIANDPEILKKLTSSPAFKKTFGQLKGEKAKRLEKKVAATVSNNKSSMTLHKTLFCRRKLIYLVA